MGETLNNAPHSGDSPWSGSLPDGLLAQSEDEMDVDSTRLNEIEQRLTTLERENQELRAWIVTFTHIIDRELAWGKHDYWKKIEEHRRTLRPVVEQVLDKLVGEEKRVYRSDLGCQTDDCDEWDTGQCAANAITFRHTPTLCPKGLTYR